jgi:hypothetical protein
MPRRAKPLVEHWPLEEIMSGDEPGWWVTLGFTSPLEPNDPLHIVASEPVGAPAGTDGRIYLERFDQAYSADPGATEVRVRNQAVEFDLTEEAQRSLAFGAPNLSFDGAGELPGYSDALRIFRAMQEAGYAVRIEERR